MDSDNEYKIKVTDEKTGESIVTAVKDLTDKQIAKLNDLSKEEPKTLEELTRDSMDIVSSIANDVGAIKFKLLFGAVSEQSIMGRLQENIRTGVGDLGDIAYKGVPGGNTARETIRGVVNPAFDMYKGGDFGANMEKIFQSIGGYIAEIPKNISQGIKDSKVLGSGYGTGYGLESLLEKLNGIGDLTDLLKKFLNIPPKLQNSPGVSFDESYFKEQRRLFNDPNNQPKGELAVNFDIKVKNETGQIIEKNTITQVIELDKLTTISKKLGYGSFDA